MTDLSRAKACYERALGVTFNPMKQGLSLVYLTVSDVDAALAQVTSGGGKIVCRRRAPSELTRPVIGREASPAS